MSNPMMAHPFEIILDTPPSPQPSSTTTSTASSPHYITEINAGHYQALLEDNTNYFVEQDLSDLLSELLRVSDNSSILHIAASTDQSESMINFIGRKSPTLLTRRDSKGDLPVHVAVRAGHETVVRNLVRLADRVENFSGSLMLEKENKEHNTALHIALENQQSHMAVYLFEICPRVCNRLNEQNISPLYLAIKAGFWDLVGNMISKGDDSSLRISKDELLKHSVIHAAIMAKRRDILEKLIEQYPEELLLHSMDEKGRRPLSYAAYIGFLDGVDCIINMKDKNNQSNTLYRSQAFKADQDGSFPIHMACSGGHIDVVEKLLSSLPDKMRWLLNQKGQTILHVAAQSGKAEVVNYLLRQQNLVTMINMKDNDGYTPLHLGALGKHPKVVYVLIWDSRTKLNLQCKNGLTALDIAEHYGDDPFFEERLTWLALIYAGVPRSPPGPIKQIQQNMSQIPNGLVLNGKTTFILTEQGQLQAINHPRKRKNKTYKERINTLLIISTLIATVTFASGFTVPGGYNNSNPKQGMATLDHKWAFQVFAITNTIAMYTSILAMVTLIWAHLDDVRLILVSLNVALPLIGTALSMMSVAFLTGLYVVLDDVVVLGIVMLVMGGILLVVLLVFLIPLYSATPCFKYRCMRYVTCVPFMLMLWACDKSRCDAI
ncbi:protein ACCELERATED CELL DEATH 6-like [Silene latifolia]|uniref:protein ACCELERATED CELL DEATH 6-like n=1 Tax=Silene latifolia TaxID=37657 RepID=UPI003D783F56